MKIGAVDLFCGIGGLTYGLRKAGIDVVAGVDLDNSCKYAFETNNHSKFIQKSVDDVTGVEIKELLKPYDVKILVGCAPCQPFSNHRKDKKDRKSHKDWSLLYQFSRIIKESNPDVVSMENVPALKKEKVFYDFVKGLEELGYTVSHSVVNTSDFGMAQSRRRLILLAAKNKKIELMKDADTIQKTVKEIIGDLPEVAAGEVFAGDRLHQSSKLNDINLKRIRASKPNGSWRDWPKKLVVPCHKKASGKSYSSVYGRMGWDGVSPTITTQFTGYGTGRFGHPEQDRALTLREGALLQSFPPKYAFISKNEPLVMKNIARHIGNAVPPLLGEAIGKSILMHLEVD
ncbi:MAG: DNA cytosine methyltransferase [Lachnospiraceae bacterium]|jgi:DNA (cytosine-5)-methyltransferase 1|nr:DNA cytosine methyltransferase [Lachnospiraceae bacterium]